jgi:DNA adenine methylase
MQYFGGKATIAKKVAEFINGQLRDGQAYYEPFCGACNVTQHIDKNREVYASDSNRYLIAFWKAIQEGWQPPSIVSEDEYRRVRANKDDDLALTAFVGFGCSFAGKFFGGYARLNSTKGYSYVKGAGNSTRRKAKGLGSVAFDCQPFEKVQVTPGSLAYCDIPYLGTTCYSKAAGGFDHDSFYRWGKKLTEEGSTVLVSEYSHNVPEGAEVVWSKTSNQEVRGRDGKRKETEEVIFTWRAN